MRIVRAQLFHYTLPFAHPVALLGKSVTTRKGYVLSLTDDYGESGWGEYAPLAEQDDLEGYFSLKEYCQSVTNEPALWIGDIWPHGHLWEKKSCQLLSVSALMAVESAVLSLSARRRNAPLASLISAKHASYVEINSLIESTDRLEARVAEIIDEGVRTVKLKVGRQSVSKDIDLVNRVRRILPAPVKLRLDANRHWFMDEAVAFAKGVAQAEIEYIEEPLVESTRLEELSKKVPCLPLAVDESVRRMSFEQVADAKHLKAVVLKPTAIGGIRRTIRLVEACQDSGKIAVISSSIESSIGLSVLAHLSAALTPGTASGLDTSRLFARDLISPGFPIGKSRVPLQELYPSKGIIDRSLLEEVKLE